MKKDRKKELVTWWVEAECSVIFFVVFSNPVFVVSLCCLFIQLCLRVCVFVFCFVFDALMT